MRAASLIFDFDSTIVSLETFDNVIEVVLRGRVDKDAVVAEFKKITDLGMTGEISFEESLSRRIALMTATRAHIQEAAQVALTRITPSFLTHIETIRQNADRIYIVSGGFEEFIFPVSDMLGIDRTHVFCNRLMFDERGICVGVDPSRQLAFAGGKAKAIEAANLPHPRIMVGDGWTDYDAKAQGAVELFVAYVEHARRERVVAHADALASSFDDIMQYLE